MPECRPWQRGMHGGFGQGIEEAGLEPNGLGENQMAEQPVEQLYLVEQLVKQTTKQ